MSSPLPPSGPPRCMYRFCGICYVVGAHRCRAALLQERHQEAVNKIARMPPLVFAGECRILQQRLAQCATGEAFMLQVCPKP